MPTKNKKLLGKNVAAARIRANFTQKSLAEAIGISIRHIQEIEYGRTDVKLSILGKIAEKLGVEPYKLIAPADKNDSPLSIATCPAKLLNVVCPADKIQVAMQIIDETGTVIFSTSQSSVYLGYSRTEICSQMKIWDFLADEDEKASLKSYFTYLLSNKTKPLPINATTLRKDSKKMQTIMDWSYLKDERENIAGILSVLNPR